MELQPYYDAPRSGPRGWLMWLVRIVALVIIVGVLIVAGRWGWQKIDTNDKKVGTSASQQSTSKPTKKSPSTTSSKSTPDSNGTNQATVTPSDDSASTSSTSTPAAASTPGNLVNTGPGSTFVLFGLVTVTGTIAYQAYMRFKQRWPIN